MHYTHSTSSHTCVTTCFKKSLPSPQIMRIVHFSRGIGYQFPSKSSHTCVTTCLLWKGHAMPYCVNKSEQTNKHKRHYLLVAKPSQDWPSRFPDQFHLPAHACFASGRQEILRCRKINSWCVKKSSHQPSCQIFFTCSDPTTNTIFPAKKLNTEKYLQERNTNYNMKSKPECKLVFFLQDILPQHTHREI